jgi:hypothetical protein
MADAFGDGWNGASISISANGNVVLVDATVTTGAAATGTFTILEGSVLSATWVSGAWNS